MANITINQLSTQGITDNDKIIKSNTDGVLSNATMKSVRDYVNGGNTPLSFSDYLAAKANAFNVNLNNLGVITVAGPEKRVVWEGDVTLPVTGTYEVSCQLALASSQGNSFWQYQFYKGDLEVFNQTSAHNNPTYSLSRRTSYAALSSGTYHVKISIWNPTAGQTVSFMPAVFSQFYCILA